MDVIPAMNMPPQAPMPAPLSGFRVLSLAEQLPGPLATMLLADLGADMILVERPAGGDPSRRFEGHFESLGATSDPSRWI